MGGGISTVSFLFEYYGQLIYGHTPQTISYQAKVGINVVRELSNKNYVHHSLNKFIGIQSVLYCRQNMLSKSWTPRFQLMFTSEIHESARKTWS